MKILATLCITLTAFFYVQPLLIMQQSQESGNCASTKNTCETPCKKDKQSKKATNDKCNSTANCNASSCCFSSHYLPADSLSNKDNWTTFTNKLNTQYTKNISAGFSTDCWQPPEFFSV